MAEDIGTFDEKELKRVNKIKSTGVSAPLFRKSAQTIWDEQEVSKSIQDARIAAANADKNGLSRTAFVGGGSGGVSLDVTGEVSRVPLLYLDPLFDPILMLFPKDNVRELNRRLRHYYQYHPIVRNIIDLHSEFPLSDFDFRCEDPGIQKYYNGFKDRLGLLELFIMMLKDYWLLGETFTYGNFNVYDMEFEGFNQYPPEDIEPYKTYISKEAAYFLKPSDEIKKVLTSNNTAEMAISQLIRQENPDFHDAMLKGKSYMLSNKYLIHMARRPNKYTIRGISPLLSCVKDLLYEDKLRMLLSTFIDRHTYPLKIFKIGSKEKGWIPPRGRFDEFKQLLMQATNDPDFSIVTHPFVEIEMITSKDKIMDLLPHFEFVKNRLMAGLFVNDAVLHGEMGPYASQAISLKILMNKYMTVRAVLENGVTEKIVRPLSIARQFIKRKQADLDHNVRTESGNEYVIPKFFWQKANLLANTTAQEFVMTLRDREEIPFKYVADMFDWDIDAIKDQFKQEEATEVDPLWREKRKEISKDAKIARQILEGTKTKKLKITEETKPEIREEIVTPEHEAIKLTHTPSPTPKAPTEEKETIPAPLGEEESPI